MQLTRLGNVELYRPESASRRACWVLYPMLFPRLTRESCTEKGATFARGGVLKFIHVVNNDTIMHAVYTCTVAFSTQSWPSVVSVLILTESSQMRTLREWLKKKLHGILWHTVTIFHHMFIFFTSFETFDVFKMFFFNNVLICFFFHFSFLIFPSFFSSGRFYFFGGRPPLQDGPSHPSSSPLLPSSSSQNLKLVWGLWFGREV